MLLDGNIVQQLLVTADRATLLSDNTDKEPAVTALSAAIGQTKQSLAEKNEKEVAKT